MGLKSIMEFVGVVLLPTTVTWIPETGHYAMMMKHYKKMIGHLGNRNTMGKSGHIEQSNWWNEQANLELKEVHKYMAKCKANNCTIGAWPEYIGELPDEFPNPYAVIAGA